MPRTLDVLDRGLHALAGIAGVTAHNVHTPLGSIRAYEAQCGGPLPTLVLLHGLAAGTAAQYVPFVLAARGVFRRVVALDLPGHGGSPPLPEMNTRALYRAVVAALDEVLDEPPIVYGNSLGGAVALNYGLSRRTRGLFLTSPAGTPLPDALLRNLLDRMLVRDDDAAALLLVELQERRPAWARFIARDVRARFAQPHIRALVNSVRNEDGFTPEALRGLDAPTLLVWGLADHIFPPEMFAYWKAHLTATIERPEGVGHVPHVEAPFWTWRRLVRFAEDVVGEARPRVRRAG